MSTRDKTARLHRRPSRTVPATIVAVLLFALGVIAAVAAVFALTQGGWPGQLDPVTSAVAGQTWGSPTAVAVTAALAITGLVLLIAAVVPGSRRTALIAVSAPNGTDTEAVISNRGLARLAAAAADSVDGVDRVSASATGAQVRVAVVTGSREQAQLVRDRVQEVVTTRLKTAGLQPAPRVRTSISTKEI